MEITNLYELKCYLAEKYPNVEDMDACRIFIKNECKLIGGDRLPEEYSDYLIPIKLVLEEQSNKYTLDNTSKAQEIIDDSNAKKIQVQVKGS